MANFDTEREGQLDFYETFLQRIDPTLDLEDILADDNDGVLNIAGYIMYSGEVTEAPKKTATTPAARASRR